MLRKMLVLAALLMSLAGMLAPRKVTAATCLEQCNTSYYTCPTQCMASPDDCYQGYQTCVWSCSFTNDPWLIC